MAKVPTEYQTPEGLRTLANYLRSQNGVKVRSAIQHEKRVEYFKGKKLIEALLNGKKWPKSIPIITDQSVAAQVAQLLIDGTYFHRSEKVDGKKGYLKISQRNIFEENGYYTWIFSGNMTWSHIATGAVIALVIGFTLLPIWPDAAKRVLWYCSVTFLIFTFAFCIIRFVLFLLLWIFGYEFWIFPRLFDETLSFQDSFKPVYSFEKGSAGQGLYRLFLLLALGGLVYWGCTQPTEFDEFLKANRAFVDDIYSGNLLSDVASVVVDSKAGAGGSGNSYMDKIRRSRVQDLDALLKDIEEDENLSEGQGQGQGQGEGREGSGGDKERREYEHIHLEGEEGEGEGKEEAEEERDGDAILEALLEEERQREEREVGLDGSSE